MRVLRLVLGLVEGAVEALLRGVALGQPEGLRDSPDYWWTGCLCVGARPQVGECDVFKKIRRLGLAASVAVVAWMTALALGGMANGAFAQGQSLPEGTLLLGEAIRALTPDDVARGALAPGLKDDRLVERLRLSGFSEEDVVRGRVVLLYEGRSWNNAISGIRRPMHDLALLPEGTPIEAGNIVERRLGRPSTILRVRARSIGEGGCRYDELPTGFGSALMGTLTLAGASGMETLFCTGIEREGWARPRTYWHKLPGHAPATAEAPAASAPAGTEAQPTAARDGTDVRAASPPPAGEVIQDCAECPELVVLPAGRFAMGAPAGRLGTTAEGPQHPVQVHAFAIGKYLVTRGRFATFVEATGHRTEDRCYHFDGRSWNSKKGSNWRNPGFAQDNDHPVTCVGVADARAYVA